MTEKSEIELAFIEAEHRVMTKIKERMEKDLKDEKLRKEIGKSLKKS